MSKRTEKYPIAAKRLKREILRERFVPKKTREEDRSEADSRRLPVNPALEIANEAL